MGKRFLGTTTLGAAVVTVLFAAQTALAGSPADMERQIQVLAGQNRMLMERLQKVEGELQAMKATRQSQPPAKALPTVTGAATATSAQDSQDGGPAWFKRIGLDVDVTGIVQGTSGNDRDLNNTGGGNTTEGSYTMDVNLSTSFAQYGSFYIHLEGGDGEGINNRVASFSVPNYDAWVTKNDRDQADVTISEAFYEFSFLNDKLTLDAGKMDVSVLFDENEVAGDETSQFMSNIFVKSMGLTIPEPDNFYCPGFMVKAEPWDLLEFRLVGASVENDNWDRLFDHGFVAGQVNFKPRFNDRQGNYRIYAWRDGRNHLENSNLAAANAAPLYSSSLADQAQEGWGLSFDQEIWDGVKGFARYSQTDDDLARWNGDDQAWEMIPFDKLWSMGLEVPGHFWRRADDVFGLAVGQTLLTDDYKNANRDTADEKYLESYYKLTLNEHFALSADLQWIQNAGGNSLASDIYIFGLRSQVNF
ncbi:MAG: carbohydrate porin [Deltaproteobacteria bacterium]|nr:carbohydrate porin [Deltaproteobacteria bacterium]